MKMAEASFSKHVYGRERKRTFKSLEEFDPRKAKFRGTANERLPDLLTNLRGENLCISLLFDEHYRYWDDSKSLDGKPILPEIRALKNAVEEFKKSMVMSDEPFRKLERDTKDQRNSTTWHQVRCYIITASNLEILFAEDLIHPQTV